MWLLNQIKKMFSKSEEFPTKEHLNYAKVVELKLNQALKDSDVKVDDARSASVYTKKVYSAMLYVSNNKTVELVFYPYRAIDFAMEKRSFEKNKPSRKLKNKEVQALIYNPVGHKRISDKEVTSFVIDKENYQKQLIKIFKHEDYFCTMSPESLDGKIHDIVHYCKHQKIQIKQVLLELV